LPAEKCWDKLQPKLSDSNQKVITMVFSMRAGINRLSMPPLNRLSKHLAGAGWLVISTLKALRLDQQYYDSQGEI